MPTTLADASAGPSGPWRPFRALPRPQLLDLLHEAVDAGTSPGFSARERAGGHAYHPKCRRRSRDACPPALSICLGCGNATVTDWRELSSPSLDSESSARGCCRTPHAAGSPMGGCDTTRSGRVEVSRPIRPMTWPARAVDQTQMTAPGTMRRPWPARHPVLDAVHCVQQQAQPRQQQHSDGNHSESPFGRRHRAGFPPGCCPAADPCEGLVTASADDPRQSAFALAGGIESGGGSI